MFRQRIITLLCAGMAACTLWASKQSEVTITVDGKARGMIVYTPNQMKEKMPLMIVCHGMNCTAEQQMWGDHLYDLVDAEKFVLCYLRANGSTWDTGGESDMNFVTQTIDAMAEQYRIDRRRVYWSGFSMGSMLIYHSIDKMTGRIAAFAPTSGIQFSEQPWTRLTRPVNLIHVQAYDDGTFDYKRYGVREYVEHFALYNQCTAHEVTNNYYPHGKTTWYADKEVWADGKDGSEVELMFYTEGSHWPKDGNQYEIWAFCKRHSLSDAVFRSEALRLYLQIYKDAQALKSKFARDAEVNTTEAFIALQEAIKNYGTTLDKSNVAQLEEAYNELKLRIKQLNASLPANKRGTEIWTGKKVYPLDWSGWQSVAKTAFTNVKAGQVVRLYFTDLKPSANATLRTGDWKELADAESVKLAGSHADFPITAAMLAQLKDNGCIIQGIGFTLTGIRIIDASDISPLTMTVPVVGNWVWNGQAKPTFNVMVTNPTSEAIETNIEVILATDKRVPVDTLHRALTIGAKKSVPVTLQAQAMEPRFYHCTVLANEEVGRQFIFGVSPGLIKSQFDGQPDFYEFWQRTKDEQAKIDPQYKLTERTDKSTSKRKVYLVEMHALPDATGDGIVRAFYAEPTGKGPYPTIMHFNGYDSVEGGGEPWCMGGDDNPTYAEIVVSTRGQVINNRSPYKNLYGDWFGYGFNDRDNYYYRGAFMDCVRALDFLCTREKVDQLNIFAEGTSQGGALTFAVAALGDGRINAIAPSIPFLGDYPDYFELCSWPGSVAFDRQNKYNMSDEEMYRMLSYFDTKNLATMINCPIYMNYSLQDDVCPPHTNWAPYNNAQSTEKRNMVNPELGHATGSSWWMAYNSFFRNHIRKENSIDSPVADRPARADDAIYTLSGIRTGHPFSQLPRGVYVQNGRVRVRR